jgi:hypothetical protein
MVKAAEAVGDVALYEPGGPGPGGIDVPQRGVTSPASPEPVRVVRELRIVKCFQQYPDDFPD